MMILIPIMSYAGSVMLVEANIEKKWLPVTKELLRTIELPYLGEVQHLFANLIATALLALFGFALLTVVFAVMSQAAGANQLGPLDVPPVRRAPRRR